METRGQTQDENGDGSGDGKESSSGGAKETKKPHESCRHDVRNGGNLGGKREKRRRERVSSEAANPDNLDSIKETGGTTRYPGLK